MMTQLRSILVFTLLLAGAAACKKDEPSHESSSGGDNAMEKAGADVDEAIMEAARG
jgi:hypothetical protein